MELSVVLKTTQVAYRKGDVLLYVSHTLQSSLETGDEARIVQIDLSVAFDKVNHQGILYKLLTVGSGIYKLSIMTQFLSKQSQHVMVDGCRSKLVNIGCVKSAARKCFGPVIVPPRDLGAFYRTDE